MKKNMGNTKSKMKGGSRGKFQGGFGQSTSLGGSNSEGQSDEYEDIELRLLRRVIKCNPEIFVLNNLMMCARFFKNYEEEIEHVKETLVSSREAELNKHLPPQKHVLLPDILQEHVSNNVGFTSTRQTFRPTIEPLHPVRIYMVHDNIDITEHNNLSHYSSVNDAVMYNILLKPTERQGYVQLQLFEETAALQKIMKEEEVDLSSIAENDSELDSDADSVYGPKPTSGIILSRRSKQKVPGNLKYGYTRSLPDLQDEKIYSDCQENLSSENTYGRQSANNVKVESDYGNTSSVEERDYESKRGRSKGEDSPMGEYPRYGRQVLRLKKAPRNTGNSYAGSTSSGYRSGMYAMDSDSSCSASQNSHLSQEYKSARSSGTTQTYISRDSKDEDTEDYSVENAKLPRRCFKRVTFTGDGKIYNPREEKKQLLNSKQRRIKIALTRHNYDLFYISSTQFMKHFIDLFVKRLAHPLGFDREAVDDVKPEGCVIYCDKVMVSNAFKYSRVEQYEIIPAVWLQWPTCAQEWLDRPRSTWPDYGDVGKIKDFGCYVVPEGFVPKKGSNVVQDLEWQLVFPTAERYLETCMTQAQVQVYMIALMLHKTFMRPIFDTMFGLTTAHIRNKLFWMIEENDRPSKWPENRAGECLLTLLNSLYRCISQNEPTLRDYFVRDRNLLQRVPCEHMLHSQKQLKRIIENPVMYVFHAMENIRHNESFFPRLDYEMLLKILTIDTLTLVNPALVQQISKPMPRLIEEQSKQEENYNKKGFWENVKSQQEQHLYSTPTVTNRTLINPRKATDSIIEISIRCAELEGPRLCALLDFFVRHFIKIAERCHQYRAYRQKIIYLDQAERLSILLSEYSRYKEDARAYRDKINALRKRNSNAQMLDDPPITPKRNGEMPIYVASLKDRFLRESLEPESKATHSQKSSNHDERSNKVTKAVVHETRFRDREESKSSNDKLTKKEEATASKTVVTNGRKSSLSKVNHEIRYREREDSKSSNEKVSIREEAAVSKTVVNGRKNSQSKANEYERVVSLVEDSNESFLSETTYI